MINYRLATRDDNQQLIELTAATGMDGEIALRIDRKPDFFKLLSMRGESKVLLALDDNNIIGSFSASLQQVYIGGRVAPLYYIADLKVLEGFRNRGIGRQLADELANHLISLGADLVFLTVAKGNEKPISLSKNRSNIADFENIGNFNIHQFIGKKEKNSNHRYKIEASPASEELITILNAHYRKYELGSVITREKLEGVSIYKISEDDKIVAIMCLADIMDAKQNVVTKVTLRMRYMLRFMNSISSIFGMSKMPSLNEPVRMLYIKYLALGNYDDALVNLLISHARNIVYEKSYSFVSIGLHERDPLNKSFGGLFKLTFQSVGMLLSLKNDKELVENVKNGVPFEDYSLV